MPLLNDQVPSNATDYDSELMTRFKTAWNNYSSFKTTKKAHMIDKATEQSHVPQIKVGYIVTACVYLDSIIQSLYYGNNNHDVDYK